MYHTAARFDAFIFDESSIKHRFCIDTLICLKKKKKKLAEDLNF